MKKAIVLCGGLGKRLLPITKTTNKHLIPLNEATVIHHVINNIVKAGIYDICVVTGCDTNAGDIVLQLEDGKQFHKDCTISYCYQVEPDGIAGALMLCERFIGDDQENFLLHLGDNIIDFDLTRITKNIYSNMAWAVLKKVKDLTRFGVANIEHGYIKEIIEKPSEKQLITLVDPYAITGIYCFNKEVFALKDELRKSDRGEYEITDILNYYLEQEKLNKIILNENDFWSDVGTFESYNKTLLYFLHKKYLFTM